MIQFNSALNHSHSNGHPNSGPNTRPAMAMALRLIAAKGPPLLLVISAIFVHAWLLSIFPSTVVTEIATCPPQPQPCSWSTELKTGGWPEPNHAGGTINGVSCPVCGAANISVTFGHDNFREGGHCPVCGASNRDRQLASILVKASGKRLGTSLRSVGQAGRSGLRILALECRGPIQKQLHNDPGYQCRWVGRWRSRKGQRGSGAGGNPQRRHQQPEQPCMAAEGITVSPQLVSAARKGTGPVLERS